MSIWHPRIAMQETWTLDPQDFGLLLDDVLWELTNLNEHNWKESTFTPTEMEPDAVLSLATAITTFSQVCNASVTTNATLIPHNGQWHTVGAIPATAYQEGSILWITACVQHSSFVTTQDTAGTWYALRVNGTIIRETITGTAEPDQDFDINGQPWGNAVISVPHMPVVLEAFYPVPPGSYNVEVVAMRHPKLDPTIAANSYPNYTRGVTLYCLELRR